MSKSNLKRRQMFNENLKKQYIEYAVSISESQKLTLFERGIVNRFIRSEDLETRNNKDICEMNRAETENFLKEFLRGGALYQTNTIGTFRSYVEWAITNNHTSARENPFVGIEAADIDTATFYADTMVKDENDLVESLNTVLDDVTRGTSDNAKWCMFLLLFAGMAFKDIFYIRKEDVSRKDKTIHYGSQIIVISDALDEVLGHYFNMDELQKGGKGESEYGKAIIDEGYLISNSKSYGNNRDKMRLSYTSDISLIMKLSSKKLKPTSIHDSGVFYRMSLKEQETGEIDCLEYLRARKHQDAVISYPDRVKKICQQEYETWKRAFNI